ncbi:MAG TPA: hypothetical protein VLG92_02190 [Candidatus Saccharimonadia bacterium]|nr:hypothetical protein [Candidatus Saccharimonadia bacterium]
MRLRVEVDKRVPLQEGEAKLSPEARALVFRGFYCLPSRVTEVAAADNHNRESREAFPYCVKVTRTHSDGTKSFSGEYNSHAYKTTKGVSEFEDGQALNRATHVERIARRLKLGTIAATVVIGTALGVLAQAGAFSSADAQPVPAVHATPNSHDIEPCSGVVTGHEVLVPVPVDKLSAVQALGEAVCSVGTFDYQIAG